MGPPAAARLPRPKKKAKKRVGSGRASFPQLPRYFPPVLHPWQGVRPCEEWGGDPCGETQRWRAKHSGTRLRF